MIMFPKYNEYNRTVYNKTTKQYIIFYFLVTLKFLHWTNNNIIFFFWG